MTRPNSSAKWLLTFYTPTNNMFDSVLPISVSTLYCQSFEFQPFKRVLSGILLRLQFALQFLHFNVYICVAQLMLSTFSHANWTFICISLEHVGVFCPFLIITFVFSLLTYKKSSLYSQKKSFVRYMPSEYFLPVPGSPI